jgi:hypothetical protein
MITQIIGWNPINVDGYENPQASVYIKPTLELLELFNRAVQNRVLILVDGTGSCYDGKKIFATIDKSSDVPNCRQNFFNCTGLYVITLDHIWYGYPLEKGHIQFLDGVVDKLINYVQDKSVDINKLDDIIENPENSENDNENKNIIEKPLKQLKDNRDDPKNLKNTTTVGKNTKSKGFDKTILLALGIAILTILIISIIRK